MTTIITLQWWQILLAAALVGINAVISVAYRLGMGRTILMAALRTTVQLTAVGFFLEWIFRLDTWWAVLPVLLGMTLLAAHAAVDRTKRRYRGMWLTALAGLFLSAASVLVFAMVVVVQVEPWWTPRYIIPILGMILGNSLTGIALGLDRFVGGLVDQRDVIELWPSHGATPSEAVASLRADAVRVGMVPIINAMMVAGTVSLPGMMTGQILSGTSPRVAVAYQIVIMFLLAGATALGTIIVVRWSETRLFDARGRLRTEAIASIR